MRSADSGRRHGQAPCNLHTPLSRAVLRSASCRRPSCVRAKRAPSPARGTGRSGIGPRMWAGGSERKDRRRDGQRSAGGRMRAARYGTARRPSGHWRAGAGRMTYRALRRAVPSAAACPRRGRRVGTAPDRGRRRAGRSAWPGRGGPGRRRGASLRIPGTPSGRARADIRRISCIAPGQFVRHAAGADVRAHGRRCWPWRPRRRGCGREGGSRPGAPLSDATCRAARCLPRPTRKAACRRRGRRRWR